MPRRASASSISAPASAPSAFAWRRGWPAAASSASSCRPLAELAERNANLNGMADRVRTLVHDLASRCRPISAASTMSSPIRPICRRRRRSLARSDQGAGDRRIERRPGALAGVATAR
jgi:hypothetical protein